MENYTDSGMINWQEEFNTGINRVDFEHRIFLQLVNSFRLALEKGRPNEELVRIIT